MKKKNNKLIFDTIGFIKSSYQSYFKFTFSIILLIILFPFQTNAGVIRYVDPASASPGSGYTSWDNAAHNIASALNSMVGGDTLIIRNGVYTGSENMITGGSIPSGTENNYTVIKAEEDFGVIIDAEKVDNLKPIQLWGDSYIEIHGIEGRNSGDFGVSQKASVISVQSSHHIKLFRCGAVEAYQQNIDSQDMSNVLIASRSSYILFEECYAWGWGKYVIALYLCDKSIIRRCIARQDGWAWGIGDCFTNYSSTNTEYQNCIAIDFDVPRHYHPQVADGLWGGFNINGSSSDVTYRGCIAKNIKGTQGVTIKGPAGNSPSTEYNYAFRLGGPNTRMENCAVIGSVAGVKAYSDTYITNCSFVDILTDNSSGFYDDGRGVRGNSSNKPVVVNSLFFDIKQGSSGAALHQTSENSNYNAFFANFRNYYLTSQGSNDYSMENGNEINFIWSNLNQSGAIKYPLRVESGSFLSGKGKDGADIGANIIQRYGASGSLYGDPGYKTLGVDSKPLWPFPNEEIIRDRMKVYNRWDKYDNIDPNNSSNPDTYVKGNRGFCADGVTLTSYIWEHLGNLMPGEINGELPPPSTNQPIAPTNIRIE